MSQFGMQMPGGQVQRGPSLTVYTGLLAVTVIALFVAAFFVFVEGSKIAPDGNAFKTQAMGNDGKTYDIRFANEPAGAGRPAGR